MTTRNKPQDYNIVRKGILENCTEPKTVLELSQLLGVDKNVAYRCANYLIADGCLKLCSDKVKKAQTYLTLSFDFTVPVVKSNYKAKEIHTPSLGGTIYTLDKPFRRNEECYQTHYIKSQQMRTKEIKSSRTYVGISSVYDS